MTVDEAERAGGGDGASDRAPGGIPFSAASHAPARPGERLIVGAMSGTSADGVDVALCAIGGRGLAMRCRLIGFHHEPYEPGVRSAVFGMRQSGSVELRALAELGRAASLSYGRAVRAVLGSAGVAAAHVAAVAAHGQTLYHAPPCTIQWLDPALLAAETGVPVVSDFRRADCAAGGQGAPLVPFADHVLFRHPTRTRALLNVGGIANVTHLPAGEGAGALGRVVAFDTGPGNCVTDHLMRLYDPGGPGYDAGGALAAKGRSVDQLIGLMLADPYFVAPWPKSTDGPAMIDVFARAYASLGRKLPLEDLLKAACLLTATTVADAIRRLDPFPDELIVSGGGVRNDTIMSLIRQPLGDVPVLRTDDLGVPAEAKEAIAFALLGAATLDGEPSNVPAATGAKRAVVLGSVTPRP